MVMGSSASLLRIGSELSYIQLKIFAILERERERERERQRDRETETERETDYDGSLPKSLSVRHVGV